MYYIHICMGRSRSTSFSDIYIKSSMHFFFLHLYLTFREERNDNIHKVDIFAVKKKGKQGKKERIGFLFIMFLYRLFRINIYHKTSGGSNARVCELNCFTNISL